MGRTFGGRLAAPFTTWGMTSPACACVASSAELEGIQRQAGGYVAASVSPAGDVAVAATEAPTGGAAGGAARGGAAPPRMQLERPAAAAGGRWVLTESEFGPGRVGGKSANLAELRRKLPAG